MKKYAFIFLVAITILSCKNETKKDTDETTKQEIVSENYPAELAKVFKAHGGIDVWKKAKVLSFNKGEEVHTTDLHTRDIVVNSPNFSLGYQNGKVWLDEEKEGTYKGNPAFYYNLYFYFYAMPFVLADDGITYTKVEDLVFEGVNYPGYKISYASDKGTSPDDNYIIYYNPKSYKMEWLAYTVTFSSKKPSEKYSLIRYNSWESSTGLVLPKAITWYKKDEKGNPTEPARPATEFTLPLLSNAKLADSFYAKPVK
ncbi:DUF6503 family protein [uncultured Polaribacter sp.]|uniref:DUF6503 family protein n=1 Tax=uncultured Polaribacter sp. TaxID=174711 RepID=UPI00260A0670|nr:DUF6503 family protein [uncultured Polaribacter sp.]